MTLHITPRERHALELLARGHSTAEVAAVLGISAHEIEALLKGLFATMGAAGQREAVAAAHRRGLLA